MKATSSGPGRSPAPPRFMRLSDLAEALSISDAQAYALVRSAEIPAIKVGGRGQWRIEAQELERYITRNYAETRAFIAAHPFGSVKDDPYAPNAPNDPDNLDDDDPDLTAGFGTL